MFKTCPPSGAPRLNLMTQKSCQHINSHYGTNHYCIRLSRRCARTQLILINRAAESCLVTSRQWLDIYALPITAYGLRLDNEDVRVVVGLRLGTAVCEPHLCACGARIDAKGSRGTARPVCSIGFGRIAWYSTINDIMYHSLSRAGIPPIKEPPGLLLSDGRKLDGLTMIPWRVGRHLQCGMR